VPQLSCHPLGRKVNSMILSTKQSSEFIKDYSLIMTQIYGLSTDKSKSSIAKIIAIARKKYCKDHSILESSLKILKDRSITISPEVISAVRSLEVKNWIYLKDTRSYSIFIDSSTKTAYGVLGLTERLRNMIGGTCAVVETGLLKYDKKYIFDGIVSQILWIGKNLKQDYSAMLKEIKRQGQYYDSFAP
jgi:hypothetical protein